MNSKKLLAATLGAAGAVAVTATLAGAAPQTSQASGPEPYQATVGYAQIEGATQGKFDGTPGNPPAFSKGFVRVLGFESALTTPFDPSTGQTTGKRQHGPFKLAIPLGAASVQAFQAAATGENLKLVELSLPDTTGNAYYRIRLTNARIVSVRQYHTGKADTHELEEISFTYQKIEFEDLPSHKLSTDSW